MVEVMNAVLGVVDTGLGRESRWEGWRIDDGLGLKWGALVFRGCWGKVPDYGPGVLSQGLHSADVK